MSVQIRRLRLYPSPKRLIAVVIIVALIILWRYILSSGRWYGALRDGGGEDERRHITELHKPLCPEYPDTLVGLVRVKQKESTLTPGGARSLTPGGAWSPPDCRPRQYVVVIVPFRNRQQHLSTFITYIHSFLQRQKLAYIIYVIEQIHPSVFNRAALLNIGFLETSRDVNYDCYIFHDVDLLPEHDYNLYTCDKNMPRHLAAFVSTTNYMSPGPAVGGVLAMTSRQVLWVNGFSNSFWGWGGEDNDMYQRIMRYRRMSIDRPVSLMGRYTMLQHEQDKDNPQNPKRLKGARFRGSHYDQDGLNSIRYHVVSRERNQLFTRISVKLKNTMNNRI